MRTTLKIFSIISVVIGGLAIIGCVTEETLYGAMTSFVGGALFLTQGILALVYIGNHK